MQAGCWSLKSGDRSMVATLLSMRPRAQVLAGEGRRPQEKATCRSVRSRRALPVLEPQSPRYSIVLCSFLSNDRVCSLGDQQVPAEGLSYERGRSPRGHSHPSLGPRTHHTTAAMVSEGRSGKTLKMNALLGPAGC